MTLTRGGGRGASGTGAMNLTLYSGHERKTQNLAQKKAHKTGEGF